MLLANLYVVERDCHQGEDGTGSSAAGVPLCPLRPVSAPIFQPAAFAAALAGLACG